MDILSKMGGNINKYESKKWLKYIDFLPVIGYSVCRTTEGCTMKNLIQDKRVWGAMIALLVIVFLVVVWPKGKEPTEPKQTPIVAKTILIKPDKEYKVLSFASAEVKMKNGKTVPVYVITFTYKGNLGTTRDTVMVPKAGLVTVKDLPINTVVWDSPIELEGKTYALARWNPGHTVPARENPALVPGKTLTREN